MGIPHFQIIRFPILREGITIQTISGYLTRIKKACWVEGVNDNLHLCHSCQLLFEEGNGGTVEVELLSDREVIAVPNRVYTFEYKELEKPDEIVFELVDYFFDRPKLFVTEMNGISEPEFFTTSNG